MNVMLKDGAFTITIVPGDETAMVTVRGKDHDFTHRELDKLAKELHRGARLLKRRIRKRSQEEVFARAGKKAP